MKEFINKKYLVTTNDWFVAPDGKQYKSAFGTIKNIYDDKRALGIKTNEKSTNWYLEIGNTIIAGCQIHYAIRTDNVELNNVDDCIWGSSNGAVKFNRSSVIYNADET